MSEKTRIISASFTLTGAELEHLKEAIRIAIAAYPENSTFYQSRKTTITTLRRTMKMLEGEE